MVTLEPGRSLVDQAAVTAFRVIRVKALARSATAEMGVLMPNLIEAMFTGFPGRSGETVKITIPARKQ